jgi:hypothetical protein
MTRKRRSFVLTAMAQATDENADWRDRQQNPARRFRNTGQDAEESMYFVAGTRAEIDFPGAAALSTVADRESPQSIDHDGGVGDVLKGTVGGERGEVEGIDLAIAEVADQQIAGDGSEARGRNRQTPWRIQWTLSGNSSEETSIGVEGVDKAVARSRDIVMFRGVLQGIRYIELAGQVLNVVNARITCNRISKPGFPRGFDSRVVFGVVR